MRDEGNQAYAKRKNKEATKGLLDTDDDNDDDDYYNDDDDDKVPLRSKQLRNEGNQAYAKRKNKEAINLYTKSIRFSID